VEPGAPNPMPVTRSGITRIFVHSTLNEDKSACSPR
jgi:hypothetical protein